MRLNNNWETCTLICRSQRLRQEMYNNAVVAGNVAVQGQHQFHHSFTVKRAASNDKIFADDGRNTGNLLHPTYMLLC